MLESISSPAGAFSPDDVQVLIAAFEQAWKAVENGGAKFALNGEATAPREAIAHRIMTMARLGERDGTRLRDDALLHIARPKGRSSGSDHPD